jgi:hypothetical protein
LREHKPLTIGNSRENIQTPSTIAAPTRTDGIKPVLTYTGFTIIKSCEVTAVIAKIGEINTPCGILL